MIDGRFTVLPNVEYEPSPIDRVRQQVELYEATNGVEGATLNGKPVIVLTCKGAKSGKLRKMPLMRIEHNGSYAVVASNAGAPRHPLWYRNIVANPLVELQDGGQAKDEGQRSLRQRKGRMVEAGGRCLFDVPYLPSLCGQCGP